MRFINKVTPERNPTKLGFWKALWIPLLIILQKLDDNTAFCFNKPFIFCVFLFIFHLQGSRDKLFIKAISWSITFRLLKASKCSIVTVNVISCSEIQSSAWQTAALPSIKPRPFYILHTHRFVICKNRSDVGAAIMASPQFTQLFTSITKSDRPYATRFLKLELRSGLAPSIQYYRYPKFNNIKTQIHTSPNLMVKHLRCSKLAVYQYYIHCAAHKHDYLNTKFINSAEVLE